MNSNVVFSFPVLRQLCDGYHRLLALEGKGVKDFAEGEAEAETKIVVDITKIFYEQVWCPLIRRVNPITGVKTFIERANAQNPLDRNFSFYEVYSIASEFRKFFEIENKFCFDPVDFFSCNDSEENRRCIKRLFKAMIAMTLAFQALDLQKNLYDWMGNGSTLEQIISSPIHDTVNRKIKQIEEACASFKRSAKLESIKEIANDSFKKISKMMNDKCWHRKFWLDKANELSFPFPPLFKVAHKIVQDSYSSIKDWNPINKKRDKEISICFF